MNELDLEEIESHLYSQIHHSNEGIEENVNTLPLENLERSVDNMRKPNRYFQGGLKNSGTKFQNNHVLATQHNLKSPLSHNYNQTEGIYSKSYTRPHKRDISINQLVVFSPQQTPIVCVSNPSKNKQKKAKWRTAKWRAKMKEKRKRQKLAKLAKLANIQPNNLNTKTIAGINCDIITVSDSDSESCVEVPNNWPFVSVADSDDENKTETKDEKIKECDDITSKSNDNISQTLVDDVIFVEPVHAPIEIINLDEEIDNNAQKKCDDVNKHADVETASITSSSNISVNSSPTKSKTVSQLHKERKELLSTPDSASNDFMNNSGVELNQTNFNFKLYGADFDNDKFLKPPNPGETCETESSSSTTDTNALNTMKMSVFNEIEFPREDIFSEANLESFGNFITPLRKHVAKETTQTSTSPEKVSQIHDPSIYSSDSSSESDFEQPSVDKHKDLSRKSKNLPDLSPMHSDNEKSSKQPKKTKVSDLTSKYDLINAADSEILNKKNKQKKRKLAKAKKKNKKRKTDFSNHIDNDLSQELTKKCNTNNTTTEDNSVAVDSSLIEKNIVEQFSKKLDEHKVESENKQKKRKSSQLLEEQSETSDNNHSKKRIKTKKKKNVTDAELDNNAFTVDTSITPPEESVDEIQEKNSNCINISVNQNDIPLSDNITLVPHKSEDQNEHVKIEIPVDVEDHSVKIDQDETLTQAKPITSLEIKSEENETTENAPSNIKTQTLIKEESPSNAEKTQESQDNDLILIESHGKENEPFVILSSDSESNLSALIDQGQDIKLINCEEQQSQNKSPSLPPVNPSKQINLMNCSLEEVQHTMSSDPKLWTILDSDRMPFLVDSRGRRCNKCREKGHMAIRCPNKVVPKCNLCGEKGHYEPRCPNRICTQCGERSPYSTTYCKFCFKLRDHQCEICFMVGHAANTCPDLWRRYHLTTTDGPLTSYSGPMLKPKNQLWCSGCARSGHLEYTCRFFKSLYPPSDPHIKSYENVYEGGHRPRGQAQQVGVPLYYETNQPTKLIDQNSCSVSYNQSSNFVMNSYSINECRTMYPDNGPFLNNPETFFEHRNAYSARQVNLGHNRNNHVQDNSQFFFEDNLPNFISFDTGLSNNNFSQVTPDRYYNDSYKTSDADGGTVINPKDAPARPQRQPRQNGWVFFSSSAHSIQYFLNNELNRLMKLSYQLKNVVKNLKKYHLGPNSKRNRYYKTLNMVLFGIYKMHDGEKHLVKLKTFKMKSLKAKLSQERRHDLYRSYCYIFGVERHGGVDYNELLRRL